jgi:peptidoglycan hydrolase-like protein with peptidoglycan-binding domain
MNARMMNARMLALVFVGLTAAGLAACSSQSAPPPAPVPVAAPAPPPPPEPTMPANLTHAQQRIAKLQMALNANGAQLDVDGKMGAKTRDALKTFQSAHNLKPTGRTDPATMKALGG